MISDVGPLEVIPLGTKFNSVATMNTDIFSSNLTVPNDGVIRLWVSESTGAIFKARITRSGTTITVLMNDGSALTADALYAFDMGAREADALNFQFASTTTIRVLNVDFIRSMGP